MKPSLLAVVVAIAVCVSSGVYAAPPLPVKPIAKEHLARGNKLYNLRSFEEAIVEYKAGALVEPSSLFDYNLGQCYRNLGQYEAAIWHYQRYLNREHPEGELLDNINGFIAQMRAELDHKAMTQKPIEPVPTDTLARVDSLAKRAPEDKLAESAHPAHVTHRWYQDGIGWGLAAAGASGVGVGVAFLASASTQRTKANETRVQADYKRLADSADTRSTVGVVVTVSGAALLVAGVVKLALVPRASTRTTAWTVGFTGEQFTLGGSF